MERNKKAGKFLSLLLVITALLAVITGSVFAQDEEPPQDHTPFFEGDVFEKAPDVTAKCLSCHAEAAKEVMGTTHWTWEYTTEGGEQYGKNNVVNNYCVAVDSNFPRCTSCHTGYGYTNDQFDFSNETSVDCLVCHADPTIYSKYPLAAGHPVYEGQELDWPKGSGNMVAPVDLAAAASSVGAPTRSNCGSCHFNGGGAPGVKHGDLDPSMANPTYELDVHMSPDGGDFTCQTCHIGGHEIVGSHYEYDMTGESDLISCAHCHSETPHDDKAIDTHAQYVACQSCHIPTFAREFPTMTYWNWETAGDQEKGVIKEEVGGIAVSVYDVKKGDFTWETDVHPTYMWFDGTLDWATVGEEMDSSAVIELAVPTAGMRAEGGMIFPFKEMHGRQAFDTINNQMIIPFLFPNGENAADAYWKAWDWDLAAARGMEAAGLEFSGELGWVDTVMYWPLTHQVPPATEVVGCTACHSETSILDFAALGYSGEDIARYSIVPSIEDAGKVVEEAAEVTVEEPATTTEEPAAVEAPVVEEETSNLTTVYIAIAAVLLLAVITFILTRKKQA